jgi:hypothetical protein
VHISRDAVFEEDHTWEWDIDNLGYDGEPFIADYFSIGGTWLRGQLYQR